MDIGAKGRREIDPGQLMGNGKIDHPDRAPACAIDEA
jgi:hypothetical protein